MALGPLTVAPLSTPLHQVARPSTLPDPVPSATVTTVLAPGHAPVRNRHLSGHSWQGRSSTDGPGRHRCRAVLRPDHRTPAILGRDEHLWRREITVFLRQQRLLAAPTTPTTVYHYLARIRLTALAFELGRFQIAYGVPVASADGSSEPGRVPLRVAESKVEFDVSDDGFPEQGRQVSSPILHRAIYHVVIVTSPISRLLFRDG